MKPTHLRLAMALASCSFSAAISRARHRLRRLALQRFQLGLQRLDVLQLGAVQRKAAPLGVAHGADQVDLRGRARGRDAGALPNAVRRVLQRGANEIGELEVLEEDVEHLVLRHGEFEIVVARRESDAALPGPPPSPIGRLLDFIAGHEFFVARQHEILLARSFRIEPEARLLRALGGYPDLAFLADIGDGRILQRFLHGFAYLRTGPPQEALAVAEALALAGSGGDR